MESQILSVRSYKGNHMLSFPALLEAQSDGGFCVTFRDIPEAITQGDNLEDAKKEAINALITAIEFHFEDNRKVPEPSAPKEGEILISLPPSVEAKVMLLNLMLQEHKRPVDLARALHVKPQIVTRIMDVHHATKIDTLAAAFQAFGRQLDIRVI